jgi:hypothetical protein
MCMVQYYTSYKVTACFMFTSKRFFIIATLNWLQGLKKVIMQETMLCMTRQNTVKRNPLQLVQRCSWIKTIKIMPEIINNKQSFWDLYASTFCFLFLFLPVFGTCSVITDSSSISPLEWLQPNRHSEEHCVRKSACCSGYSELGVIVSCLNLYGFCPLIDNKEKRYKNSQ